MRLFSEVLLRELIIGVPRPFLVNIVLENGDMTEPRLFLAVMFLVRFEAEVKPRWSVALVLAGM